MRHVKNKENTVSDWGEFPSARSVEDLIPRSLVVIDKPQGPTSHQVSAWVRDIFGEKVGHSGTLDPNVTGILPMGIGRSVRLLDLLHSVPKEYVAAMKVHGEVDDDNLDKILDEFEGEIYQTPPLRAGVKRQRRKRKIFKIQKLDSKDRDILLRIRCESGTYIRTLCKDLGKTLGTGGHMMELRRVEAGGFTEDDMVILQDLRDAYEFCRDGECRRLKKILMPYERALDIFPKVRIKDTASGTVLNGADLAAPGILEMEDFSRSDKVALISPKGEGIAVGSALYDAEEIVDMDEGLVFRSERVFSPSGDYPKRWK
ncbi:MAG: RNA-guided pseudouridylation complex pseudouridine synthase subunit Cbf5 [Candidatus Thermoplasmatota archaeon]|nr:RNA-guided pseudouridylation complex pseudouridine synthase subunit Cbf5 [Candidatus Thermoplasmatota archaeon]MBS3789848.1 RNA-guided pseudouridylation complex pseudouridine synthase subunit Cbf5 [Candidatus Thermoplasmatota archaeon]